MITVKLPATPREFYIKIYLKKDHRCNKLTLREAIKSWNSLEPQEKHIIIKKHKNALISYQTQFGKYLKTAGSKKSHDKTSPTMYDVDLISNSNSVLNNINKSRMQHDTSISNDINGHGQEISTIAGLDGHISILDTLEPANSPPPPPEVPKVVKPKDLYDAIHTMDKRIPYPQLSRLEKRPYQDALLAIKRLYLKKYESYIHSLSDEQLYKHMITVINQEMS